ncbi:MAG: hypothetical protein KDK70_37870, partial [Myxococcales bacterium]|nr:hypothetical protein [Myxococcales bacterium]
MLTLVGCDRLSGGEEPGPEIAKAEAKTDPAAEAKADPGAEAKADPGPKVQPVAIKTGPDGSTPMVDPQPPAATPAVPAPPPEAMRASIVVPWGCPTLGPGFVSREPTP